METITTHDIRETMFPGKVFITRRDTVSFDKLTEFFSKSYGEMYGLLQRMEIKSEDPPCAIYYSVDEAAQKTELAAAVPVNTDLPTIKEFETVVVPKGKAIVTTHHGSYDTMGTAYDEMEGFMKEHKLQRSLIIEEYLTDPAVEKDPAKWETNIYFIVK